MKSLILFIILSLPLYSKTFYTHLPLDKNVFAITFDDGPSKNTEKILEVLRKYNARANFFILGENVKYHRKEMEKLCNSPHLIGSHTYSHINFYRFNREEQKIKQFILLEELNKTQKELNHICFRKLEYIRMPYGYSKSWVIELFSQKGYKLINWTFGYDWSKISKEELIQMYLEHVKPGEILLLHDRYTKDNFVLELLEKILKKAKEKNLKPVRLDEILR